MCVVIALTCPFPLIPILDEISPQNRSKLFTYPLGLPLPQGLENSLEPQAPTHTQTPSMKNFLEFSLNEI